MAITFNCGIGMIVIVAAGDAPKIVDALTKAGENVYTIGSVIKTDDERVVIDNAEQNWMK
jgi:phosphoribosylformylglycinamidine cyclo-ligase